MAAQYAHLHIMTNNPTKYESNPASSYRGVAVTRILMENSLSPITPTKIIKSTWRHSMHIYTSWPTILLNMKAIRQAVTEEKPWQEQDWRTDRQTDGRTGQKHYTPRNFVAWGIIIMLCIKRCIGFEVDLLSKKNPRWITIYRDGASK